MYRLTTPGIVQFARRHIAEMGGGALLPVATRVAVLSRMLYVPKNIWQHAHGCKLMSILWIEDNTTEYCVESLVL